MYRRSKWFNGALAATIAVAGLAGITSAPAAAAPAPASVTNVATPPPAALLEKATGTGIDTVDTGIGNPPALNKSFKGKADKGVKAPKSDPGRAVASIKAGGVTTMAACSPACYRYAGFFDNHTKLGASINMSVHAPPIDVKAAHSLAEVAVSKVTSNGQTQHVEIGWTVDPTVNANSGCTPQPACKSQPHLFTFAWVNGAGLCYNGCGFVKNTSAVAQVGKSVNAAVGGSSLRAGILYFQGNWWVRWGNEWVGYWPASLWTSTGVTDFVDTPQQAVFGEVALFDDTSCADMGAGVLPSAGPPAVGGSLGSWNTLDANGSGTLRVYNGGHTITQPANWNLVALSGSTVRYGGPGPC